MREYQQNTAELIHHYRREGLLCEVRGEGDIEEIYGNIVQALNRRAE